MSGHSVSASWNPNQPEHSHLRFNCKTISMVPIEFIPPTFTTKWGPTQTMKCSTNISNTPQWAAKPTTRKLCRWRFCNENACEKLNEKVKVTVTSGPSDRHPSDFVSCLTKRYSSTTPHTHRGSVPLVQTKTNSWSKSEAIANPNIKLLPRTGLHVSTSNWTMMCKVLGQLFCTKLIALKFWFILCHRYCCPWPFYLMFAPNRTF